MNTQSTAMMERTPFLLPDVAASNDGFTKEELAQDIEEIGRASCRERVSA